MLPKKNRLTKKGDFERVSSKGNYFSFQNISLKTTSNNSSFPRIGFSIGKKISVKAINRNQIKRVLRESFQEHLPKIAEGVDIVVYFKKDNQSEKLIDSKKTAARVEKLLKKANLIQ
ncbi:MAG: Ribonuclease P protein component [Candidatus Moranbacteria bacterium GW2011_GWE2_35_2-]|nr:MAG: Ribonuclease P protein component [Candidatus Moranbacteria bacterium GW2011_GWE2_35_2-]KKQ22625.1 MAG: Ribonuclease P protein component [Candidatus Moranbacteria bacterium GW2011_GWF2_37_11]KKQ29028.1 MAG: Ribonuclease P protein component [Candidatus Moranbacteria bacterium GW2011_GWD1_37_17]KKQ30436.1 MAG: Ribonuclease P protein component [Candidatus Moranbacteria bacterium GW2011_GWE1_37_24]KKQ47916.1 MAG: Ribonuclease P protein component [Candidatus Moranbacteria bacterium GW2011_GWD